MAPLPPLDVPTGGAGGGMITSQSPRHGSGGARSTRRGSNNFEMNSQSVNSATGRAQAVFVSTKWSLY
jgi:hypothetical protein